MRDPFEHASEATDVSPLPPEAAVDLVLEAFTRLDDGTGEGVAVTDIAEAVGRSRSWVGEKSGFAVRVGWLTGPVERPRPVPRENAGVVVGVDLGGTKLIGAAADMTGRILAEIEEPTRDDRDNAAFEQIEHLIDLLIVEAGVSRGALQAVAIGVPGAVSAAGEVSLAPNLRIDDGRGFVRRLRERLGVEVRVENDVNIAAFGEYRRGVGRGAPSLAFLALGTGVGMGLVLSGAIHRGQTGAAGEIGFLPVGAAPLDGAAHEGGGYFEDLVGTRGIRRRYDDVSTVREIFERAAAGDEKARRVIAETARDTALGVAGVAAVLDPSMIVLGGGIGSRADFVAMVEAEAKRLAPIVCPIAPSALGPRAGLIGAVMSALVDARSRVFARADGRV